MSKQPLTKEQRIQLYVERTGIAISGQEGSRRTMAVARTLYTGFDLSEADTIRWLTKFSERCDPPWDEKDILRKVKAVVSTDRGHKKGWMLQDIPNIGNGKLEYEKVNREPVKLDFTQAMEHYLGKFSCTEADLYDASPIKPSEDFRQDGPLLVEHLFSPGEGVNFVTNFKINKRADGREKADPVDVGTTMERDSLVRSWRMDGVPSSDAGGWLRINPVNGHVDDNSVTALRHMLVEFDKIPTSLQLCYFARFNAPIAALLTSGGQSIHAWLKVDCVTRGEYDALFLSIQSRLARFGMDSQNKNPGRLSRLVGAIRKIGFEGDGHQRLLYLNPNPSNHPIIT